MTRWAGVVVVCLLPACAAAATIQEGVAVRDVQTAQAAPIVFATPQPLAPYVPITPAKRVRWTIRNIAGPSNLAVGVWTSSWNTAIDSPHEWKRTWSGFGKRYADREASVVISNSIEGSLGALWGEDPRYRRSESTRPTARAAHAFAHAFVTERPDGHKAPAWARYTGDVVSQLARRSWVPPSATTAKCTAIGIALGLLGRAGANAWKEFAPDIRRLYQR